MNESEWKRFIDSVAATAIATKAALVLEMAGLPLTRENASQVYGPWLNPDLPHFDLLVTAIDAQVFDMLETAKALGIKAGPTH